MSNLNEAMGIAVIFGILCLILAFWLIMSACTYNSDLPIPDPFEIFSFTSSP